MATLTGDGLTGRAPVLTGSENLTQRQLVRAIGDALGEPVQLVELPPDTAREQMVQAMPAPIADTLLRLLADSVGRSSELTDEVREITGHPPRTFADWAQENVAAFT